jgi:hypothetical protein
VEEAVRVGVLALDAAVVGHRAAVVEAGNSLA